MWPLLGCVGLLRSHAGITCRTLTGSATDATGVGDHALVLTDHRPEAPAEQDVFAPDYAPDETAEIAQKLRTQAGFGRDAARARRLAITRTGAGA